MRSRQEPILSRLIYQRLRHITKSREHTLARFNQSRRLSKDYERLPQSSEAIIYLSMTRFTLRRLTVI